MNGKASGYRSGKCRIFVLQTESVRHRGLVIQPNDQSMNRVNSSIFLLSGERLVQVFGFCVSATSIWLSSNLSPSAQDGSIWTRHYQRQLDLLIAQDDNWTQGSL